MSAVAITGGPATGKTTLLLERYRDAAADGRALLLAPNLYALGALRRKLGSKDGTTLAQLAADLIGARLIDDIAAEALFERAAAPLLALAWPEFADGSLDAEVSGLRMPHRFLESAFRLVRKLRDGAIGPDEFLRTSQAGSTTFYGRTPNLASSDLLMYTKENYRDSLDVDARELQRQFRHEAHLAKILAKLYTAYIELQEREGVMTGRDAIIEATQAVQARADLQSAVRERYDAVFIDDAQELTMGELGLLQAIRGPELAGVTFAGDPKGATGTFRGARPDAVFKLAGERIELAENRRNPHAIASAALHLAGGRVIGEGPVALHLYRARDARGEITCIADHVAELVREGTKPDEIAVLFRSVRNVRAYEDAFRARNIPAIAIGDVNFFDDPRALDALALLWNVHDPFRHDYLLRTLAGPAMALSDATLDLLCREPDAQALLFTEDESAVDSRSKRWDPRRDLRLGWNVVHGEADATLSALARERLERFRALRAGWVTASQGLALVDLARRVWSEGLATLGAPGSVAASAQEAILRRVLTRIERFALDDPTATLGAFLADAELRGASTLEACDERGEPGFVRLISIEAARGLEFDHIVIPGAKAGSFPRWYVPDSFLYSPNLGTVAKDNVGDATAGRTAKFSYYVYRTKARERFNQEEQRALAYALTRARKSALVTAWGRPTRGITAPEFLENLRNARLPGTEAFAQ